MHKESWQGNLHKVHMRERSNRKEISMHEWICLLWELPQSLFHVCATELRFEYVGVTLFGTLLALTIGKSVDLDECSNSSAKWGNNFCHKLSILPKFCILFCVESSFLSFYNLIWYHYHQMRPCNHFKTTCYRLIVTC